MLSGIDPSQLAELDESQLRELERLLSAGDTRGTVRTGDSDTNELVAYYVPTSANAPAAAELRAHVARLLPASHVPVRYVPVVELPRLANGKLDRHTLAILEKNGAGTEAQTPPVPPSDDLERWIAGLWTAILDVPVDSVQADFFALGGGSLHAMRLLGRIGLVLGVELGLMTLFDHPTLATFAAEVRRTAVGLPDFDEIVSLAAEVYVEEDTPQSRGGE